MKKFYRLFILSILFSFGSSLISQNVMIDELYVLDSNSTAFHFAYQSLVYDNYTDSYHFIYVSHDEINDYIIKRTSVDDGKTWNTPDTISTHTPSSASVRYYAGNPSATIDDYGNLHVLYEYRGLPLYTDSWPDYPPSHMNDVYYETDHWVTDVNVINDHDIQAGQGNSSTVCYLFDNQITNLNGSQYYIAYDYAWWATKYNIVVSDNRSGEWTTGIPLYTYDLGAIDNRVLNAPSLIENDGILYAIWYQKQDCYVEMMTYEDDQWSDLSVLYNDTFVATTGAYTVGVGSYSNGSKSLITMQRVPETDFNELIILKKSVAEPWVVDTLMLDKSYAVVRPTISGDTTLLFLVSSSGEYYSYLMKHIHGQGDISKVQLTTSNMEERFYNFITSRNGDVNPLAYMVYNEAKGMYYLKVGELSAYTGIDEIEVQNNKPLTLKQNYPNPAKGNTTITYIVNEGADVKLSIYDIYGKLINTVVDKYESRGKHSVIVNTSELDEGIYFYELRSGNFTKSARMIVIK